MSAVENKLVYRTALTLFADGLVAADNPLVSNKLAFSVTVATLYLAIALRDAFKQTEFREDAMVDAFQAVRDLCEQMEKGEIPDVR